MSPRNEDLVGPELPNPDHSPECKQLRKCAVGGLEVEPAAVTALGRHAVLDGLQAAEPVLRELLRHQALRRALVEPEPPSRARPRLERVALGRSLVALATEVPRLVRRAPRSLARSGSREPPPRRQPVEREADLRRDVRTIAADDRDAVGVLDVADVVARLVAPDRDRVSPRAARPPRRGARPPRASSRRRASSTRCDCRQHPRSAPQRREDAEPEEEAPERRRRRRPGWSPRRRPRGRTRSARGRLAVAERSGARRRPPPRSAPTRNCTSRPSAIAKTRSSGTDPAARPAQGSRRARMRSSEMRTTIDAGTRRRYRGGCYPARGREVHVVLRLPGPVAAPAPADRRERTDDRRRHHAPTQRRAVDERPASRVVTAPQPT